MRGKDVGIAAAITGVLGVAGYVALHTRKPLVVHKVPVYFVGEAYRDARGDIWHCTTEGWQLFVSYNENTPSDPLRPLTLLKDES